MPEWQGKHWVLITYGKTFESDRPRALECSIRQMQRRLRRQVDVFGLAVAERHYPELAFHCYVSGPGAN